jgi:hypothetical protein
MARNLATFTPIQSAAKNPLLEFELNSQHTFPRCQLLQMSNLRAITVAVIEIKTLMIGSAERRDLQLQGG